MYQIKPVKVYEVGTQVLTFFEAFPVIPTGITSLGITSLSFDTLFMIVKPMN